MMTFDKKVPLTLRKTQEWFASIITRPVSAENQMMPISPSGIPMEDEAKLFIVPSPKLRSDERIQIYNQQYWWRLLTILQDDFPLVTRLFGYHEFNQTIAFPYLVKYPPSHWSLEYLGKSLTKWIDECYSADDKELILNASIVDHAYRQSFFAAKNQPIRFDLEDREVFSKKILSLQPHVHLFSLDYDLFSFRDALLKEDPDHWLEHDFPKLEKGKFHFILYRNHQNFTLYDAISPVAYQILNLFQKGAVFINSSQDFAERGKAMSDEEDRSGDAAAGKIPDEFMKVAQKGASIDQICEWLENEDEAISEEAATHMQEWFQCWSALHLLTISKIDN